MHVRYPQHVLTVESGMKLLPLVILFVMTYELVLNLRILCPKQYGHPFKTVVFEFKTYLFKIPLNMNTLFGDRCNFYWIVF